MVILHQKDNKIMPRGWPGELGLSGDQLARGYLNMPEQTSKVFVTIPGIGRVYRTGDFARLVPGREGGEWFEVEYLGRMNAGEQVKLSGRRVELSEVSTQSLPTLGAMLIHNALDRRSSEPSSWRTFR